MVKKIRNLMAAGAAVYGLMAGSAESAVTASYVEQSLGNTKINKTFTNNDNAIFNSATDNLTSTYGNLLDIVSTQHPDYLGLSNDDLAQTVTIAIRSPPTGEVSDGWTSNYNAGTGLVNFQNNGFEINDTFTGWYSTQDNPNQDMMAVTYDFHDMFDFNKNGITDANELLIENGTLTNGFIGYQGGLGFTGDTQMYTTAIPEPSTSALGALGGLALLLRRNRTTPCSPPARCSRPPHAKSKFLAVCEPG